MIQITELAYISSQSVYQNKWIPKFEMHVPPFTVPRLLFLVCYCLTLLWLAKVIQHQWQWMIGWWWSTGAMILTGTNQSTVREICPSATPSTRNYTWTALNQTQASVATDQQLIAGTTAWAPVILFAGKQWPEHNYCWQTFPLYKPSTEYSLLHFHYISSYSTRSRHL
jgi:hypothetical protein